MGLSAYLDQVAIDPDTLVGFEPLVAQESAEGQRGQTHLESIGSGIQRAAVNRAGAPTKILLSTAGWGGSPYSQIKKGTAPYGNLVASVTKAKALAEERGWAYWVPFVCFQHGESDGGNSQSYYFSALQELQADLDADIRAITGQAAVVKIYAGQYSTFMDDGKGSVRAIYQAAKELTNVVVVGPQYTMTYASDFLHMDGPGYFRIGEYHVKALLAEQYGTGTWTPLKPASVTWDSATQVDIEFDVPVEPLVLDNVLVSDPGDYGFEYADDTSTAAIQSVAVLNPTTIRITLTATPTGSNKTIRYAMSGYSDPRVGGDGPRGCLRDSDPAISAIGGPLFNWCLHFEEPIE